MKPLTHAAKGGKGLVYIGPAGQESPTFGPLVPGESYQHDNADFVAYLCERHPDYWRRPASVTPHPPAEKE